MPPPEIDMGKLRVISLEMAKYVNRLECGRAARKRGELLSVFNAPDEGVEMGAKDVDTIARQILKLAEENKEMRHIIFSINYQNKLHPNDWPAAIQSGIDKILGVATRKGDTHDG